MIIQGKRIAVTGASGMLGVYIVRALLRAGANVCGVVRNPQKAAFLADEGVTFATADLTDRPALLRAFSGADAVVSNAALFDLYNHRWHDNFRANKEGTENVYEAAAAAGVRRIVHISTFGIYRFWPGRRFAEDAPQIDGFRRQGGAYRATKQISESLAWSLSAKHRLQLTVLRPTGIFGARDTNTLPIFKRWMRLPIAPVPRATLPPLVYAGDVAQAVVGALKNDASIGRAYNTGGTDATLYDFMRAWKNVTGQKTPLLLPIPGPSFWVDNRRAEQDLGFHNRPFADALREIFAEEAARPAALAG